LHVSMVLPPPTAISPSQSLLRAYARLLHGAVGGLHLHAVPDVGLTPCSSRSRAHALGQAQPGDVAVGEDQGLADAQAAGVEADPSMAPART
jgi:hypothetical protein